MSKACALSSEAALRLLRKRILIQRKHVDAARNETVNGIHDLRVASRRLRAALREHRICVGPEAIESAASRVREITQALGKARELDVTQGVLRKRRRAIAVDQRPAVNFILRRLGALRRAESEQVQRAAKIAASPELDRALAECFMTLRPASRCYARRAAKRLQRQWRAARQVYYLWEGLSSEETLHRLRVCFKKLRYAAELYAPLYDDRLASFIEQLKLQQEGLGTWNDLRVARDYARRLLEDAPPRALVGGDALTQVLDAEADASLQEFRYSVVAFFSSERETALLAFFRETIACCRDSKSDAMDIETRYA